MQPVNDFDALQRLKPSHTIQEPLSGNMPFAVEPEMVGRGTEEGPHKHTT